MRSLLDQAITILRQGGLVAMPTETVYGLGADAKNADALRKIFQAKQRPIDHPLIVHLADTSQLSEWVSHISPMAKRLATAFWPGPLTLILPKAPSVLDLITGNQQTIGIRIPHHPIAQALLQGFGGGIAAPSANRFGRISPTTAHAVREELGDAVDLILDGGPCEIGLESTIVDVSVEHPVILRPGMITATQIEAVLHETVQMQRKEAPRVSGSCESHYAPATTTQLLSVTEISHFLSTLTAADLPLVLLIRSPIGKRYQEVTHVMMPNDPKLYAQILYQTLRELDQKQFKHIVIEDVPENPGWLAIRDRLLKASFSGRNDK